MGASWRQFSRRRSQCVHLWSRAGRLPCGASADDAAGKQLSLATPDGAIELRSPLIGRVNVYNVLAACAAAYARGCTPEQIAQGIAGMSRVPGRFERVDEAQPFAVVVDYAHTDDALKNLTRLARDFASAATGG